MSIQYAVGFWATSKNMFIALCELGFVMNVTEYRNCNKTCSGWSLTHGMSTEWVKKFMGYIGESMCDLRKLGIVVDQCASSALVETFSVEFQQNLWCSSWDKWNSPFVVWCKLGSGVDRNGWTIGLSDNFKQTEACVKTYFFPYLQPA